MFCFQCEQTAKGTGCNISGVCGKTPDISDLQDLLIANLKGIAFWGKQARELGVRNKEVDVFILEGLFTTVTNVDFDAGRLQGIISRSQEYKNTIRSQMMKAYKEKHGTDFTGAIPAEAALVPAGTVAGLQEQAKAFGILTESNEDIRSLKELLKYGLKGMSAYAYHAHEYGQEDEAVFAFFHTGLNAMLDQSLSVADLVALNMELGKVNLRAMELLDHGNTGKYGDPVPTEVFLGVKKGPAILVSGHDLPDLEELLRQTEGKGVNIYTHGEMLPAHGYPVLKKYRHLVGNYGGAWQDQQKEFDAFPGAILMTTNCIQKPKDSYKDRIFTTGLVAWPDVTHVADHKDFSAVIDKAIEVGGFPADVDGKKIMVGFARNTVMSVAGTVIDAVKSGAIKHFFLIGGCDGAKPGRNYYTELAEKAPKDTVILTLACGKYRFNKLDFGDIGGIPRLLDIGQCNDAYSAIQIAVALSKAFNVGVNELPLSLVLSWYEQKAVCILLTLLHLGIRNIKLGPSLPAFVSPTVLNFLVENFNIQPTRTADEDLAEMLNR